jgi:uncharacterized protein involved in outer membrane biogenesis
MRLIGYTMFGLGLGLLLLAGAALVFDLGALKPLYERVAGHYLEREVRVKGEMSVRFGRSVTASATDVTILGTDPDAAPLAQAEFVEVQLALPALFDKVVDIELARLEGATLNLEIDDQGQGNWPSFEDDGPAQADRGDDAAQADDNQTSHCGSPRRTSQNHPSTYTIPGQICATRSLSTVLMAS